MKTSAAVIRLVVFAVLCVVVMIEDGTAFNFGARHGWRVFASCILGGVRLGGVFSSATSPVHLCTAIDFYKGLRKLGSSVSGSGGYDGEELCISQMIPEKFRGRDIWLLGACCHTYLDATHIYLCKVKLSP